MSWYDDRPRYEDDTRAAELEQNRRADDRIRKRERQRDREIYERETRRARDAAADRDVDPDYW